VQAANPMLSRAITRNRKTGTMENLNNTILTIRSDSLWGVSISTLLLPTKEKVKKLGHYLN
jgi:hypothetical protein